MRHMYSAETGVYNLEKNLVRPRKKELYGHILRLRNATLAGVALE